MREQIPSNSPERLPRLCFERGGGSRPLKSTKRQPGSTQEKRNRLCCAVCATPITSRDMAVDRSGQHEHTFTNPHGIGYRIGCFASAMSLAGLGSETDEYTWFPGYYWRVMLCSQCNALLGWRYRSVDDEFFGLVVRHLMPCD